VAAGARFCSECGKSLASVSPPRQPMKLSQITDIYKRGDLQQSKALLLDYVQSAPKETSAWILLGNVLRDLDEDDEAEKAYMTALQLNPLAYEAHTGLGVVNRKRGFYDLAVNFYQLALQANPRYAQAYSSMAHVELKRGRDAQALQYALKGYELDKKDPVVAANLAVCYHYNNRFAERDRMLQVAQKLGYRSLDGLQRIFRGETSVRD
jgi:Flp pilus assembly protein TadD